MRLRLQTVHVRGDSGCLPYAWREAGESRSRFKMSKVTRAHKAFRGNFVISDDEGKKFFVLKSAGMPQVGSEVKDLFPGTTKSPKRNTSVPKFLEANLKKEYGAKSKVPYKVMNSIGAMVGNKETAKGEEMQRKHEADMAKFRGEAHGYSNKRPKRKVLSRYAHHPSSDPTG